MPFENLTGDAAVDWISNAAPGVLSNQLGGAPKAVVLVAVAIRDAYAQQATHVLHGYFTRRGQALHIESVLEDLATHRTLDRVSSDSGVLPSLDTIAKGLDSAARPFPVTDPSIVEAWVQAVRSRTGFEAVAARAPDFGLLYVTWVEALAAHNDRAGALRVIELGLARPALKSDLDRTRLELMRADIDANAGARADAFNRLAKLSPHDINVVRGAAEANYRARRFPAAIDGFRAVAKLEPENAALVNLIGYAQALGGDLAAAKRTIEEYQRLPGQEPNALDSLGEVHFFHGKFDAAERYFLEAHGKTHNRQSGYDLYKAALARWLAGDTPGADALHQRYLEFRAKQSNAPPTVGPNDLLLAQWEWTTARPDAARRRLERRPEYAAQLILWNGEAARLPPPFALLAAKKFSEALPVWKQAYELSDPSTDSLPRTLYAWCLKETGNAAAAKALLTLYGIPQERDGILATLVYPKFLELRK